ncbi:class I adenylate-forming enzyme family protein [Kutzneria kofuensis]|nr:class I adenylate-forming enzyme family protein [Kutzneria kofuensis]
MREPVVGNVVAVLDQAAARHGARPAVRDATGRWTWAELDQASQRVARALGARGIGPGSRVLSIAPPGRDFAALLFGTMRAGASLIPARPDASAFELDHIRADAAPALVVGSDDRPTPAVPVTTLLRQGSEDRSGPSPAGSLIAGDQECLLLYTSGSTGRPKGIVCPHASVAFAVRAIGERLGYRPDDVVWNRLPMCFDYGLYQLFLCALAGAELVTPPGVMSAAELVALREAGASVLPIVPTAGDLLARLAVRDRRPTNVRLVTNTGAALTGPLAERVRLAFPDVAVVCMYGMTECKRITIADPDEDLAHPATVGRPLPGTRVLVVDAEGRNQPPGAPGEIVAVGPHVMAGYWNSPQETARRFRPAPDTGEPAVFTGDRGYLDPDGRLYFLGRDDDVFKHRGWRMSTLELETALLDIPDVRAAAALPPDAAGTLTVWAVTSLPADHVRDALAERLGAARAPDRCVVLPELPQTPNGKVDRAALRALREAAP